MLAGSGTASTSPVSENTALKVGITPLMGPTMSVPTRSQSGSIVPSQVQLCKSVKPDGNGVPGGMMGFGAESQKKAPSPLVTSTLRYKEVSVGRKVERCGEGHVELDLYKKFPTRL